MNAVFTIVAKNYTGLGAILEKSVRQHANADYYIFISDEPDDPSLSRDQFPASVVWSREVLAIEEPLWNQLAFKYNLVEFATAIKPFCYDYLFDKKQYDRVVFFDPDVLVFNTMEPIFSGLDDHTFMLTPHILDMHPPVKSDHPSHLFLLYGTFNLGFMAMKKNELSRAMLNWWKEVLISDCFFDNDRGTATDQKWISLLPALVPQEEILISRDRGLNAAPWNFHEREFSVSDGRVFVSARGNQSAERQPLTFVHFSGYDYSSFSKGGVVHKKEDIRSFPDLSLAFDRYAEALAGGDFAKYIGLRYSYNTFDNGKNILSLHRRLYRRLLDEHKEFGNPFTTAKGSYYDLLRRKKLIDHSAVQADKVTGKTISGFDRKLGKLNFMAGMLKRLVGVRKYSMLARFFRRYFKEENQAFLVDKEAGNKLWH